MITKAISSAKSIGIAALGFDALNVTQGVADYKAARQEGDSSGVAIAKAAGSAYLFEAMGVYGIALAGIQVGSSLVGASSEHTTKQMGSAYQNVGKFGSGYFEMSQSGYTMRQRSLNAIRNNGLVTQSALGNEARTYFRSGI